MRRSRFTGRLCCSDALACLTDHMIHPTKDEFLLSMTNHGRSRKTRGRGFDDDFGSDRSPFNDRPSFGDRAPAVEAPRFGGPPAGFGPEIGASVKWFNPEKGFGFVELSDGSGDVFLHINALSSTGTTSVSPGATLRVRVGQGQKGRQVTEVLSVDESTAVAGGPARGPAAPRPGMAPGAGPRRGATPGTGTEMRGTVKMYNAVKGFGFVAVPEAEKDVFVHASVLQRNGLTTLTEGQTVVVEVVQGAKGPEAVSVRLN
jgi:CspA family cold shock protein